jgi:hypothetical protein
VFLSEAISLIPVDCFGKKRLAMTHLPIRNEYKKLLLQNGVPRHFLKNP